MTHQSMTSPGWKLALIFFGFSAIAAALASAAAFTSLQLGFLL